MEEGHVMDIEEKLHESFKGIEYAEGRVVGGVHMESSPSPSATALPVAGASMHGDMEGDDASSDHVDEGSVSGGDSATPKPRRVFKNGCVFIYLAELALYDAPPFGSCKSIAVVGDYIAIGHDFAAGLKSPSFVDIHAHMSACKPAGRDFLKMGHWVPWAVDFVFLDLTFGGDHPMPPNRLDWDILTEEHMRQGIFLSTSLMLDDGWLVVMASPGGEGISCVERYCRASRLSIARCILVVRHTSYGSYTSLGSHIEVKRVLKMVRACASIDVNAHLMRSYVTPLLQSNNSLGMEDNTVTGADVEENIKGKNPFYDYVLPVYAEAHAKAVGKDPRCEENQPPTEAKVEMKHLH